MRLVILEPATTAPAAYSLRLGPLSYPCPLDAIGESLGDGLEAVGAALVAAERRPRPFKLTLPVRGDVHEALQRDAGLRLRRQTRQLLENARWLSHGLAFSWRPDPDLEAWLLVGGGDLTETDPGVTFGDFTLELTDCFLVGRPGTHRAARRLELADRRTGLVPRTTRGLVLTTDYAAQALPTTPAILPGDVVSVVGAAGTPASASSGPVVSGRRLYRGYSAVDGEVLSYLPDELVIPSPLAAALELEAPGGVRAWNQSGHVLTDPAAGTPLSDRTPELYGWERLYGAALERAPALALDNGLCRLLWLGNGPDQGLALEAFDATAGRYVRHARALHAANVREAFIVELTADRAVLEWRAIDGAAMRAVLQRGWYGPRLESYRPGGTAALDVAMLGTGQTSAASASPAWVRVATAVTGMRLAGAQSHAAATWTVGAAPGAALNAPVGRWSATDALAVQAAVGSAGPTDTELASLSLADAQAVPVLLARGL